MRVVITDAAKTDLIEIGGYISQYSPRRAASFLDELLDHCEALADMPRAFPLIPRYERHGIRRRAHRDYLIFYRVGEGFVEVIHILHGARDYEALLFPQEIPAR
ncbi:type II toxin-antitoxin system RelE/ParE family toxin [Methylomagnum sp.]